MTGERFANGRGYALPELEPLLLPVEFVIVRARLHPRHGPGPELRDRRTRHDPDIRPVRPVLKSGPE